MGNWERNLVIFGAAMFLAVAGIFLYGNLIVAMVWVFFVLAIAMFLSLGRFGPDRATLEEWLLRRWRYSRSVKKYTYARPTSASLTPAPKATRQQRPPAARPVTLADDAGAYYSAVTVMLVVAGIVFAIWLGRGGDAALAQSLQSLWR